MSNMIMHSFISRILETNFGVRNSKIAVIVHEQQNMSTWRSLVDEQISITERSQARCITPIQMMRGIL